MNKRNEHIIESVEEGSIAYELELQPGDVLLKVNKNQIEDIFDYQYMVEEEKLLLLVRKANGEEWELEIEKDFGEDIGITFSSSLMDDYRSCHNKCIFCFIDQMPEGMRDTLYFKDDDTRLSFLQGNYVTLTNMKDKDLDRIIKYRLGPINISIQATNPELRCKMLQNRFAGDIMDKIKKLADANIPMNSQIVLCKDINDKEELERSIEELSGYMPVMASLSVVPIGLTKFRQGLYPVEPFFKDEARDVLAIIHKWQKRLTKEKGSRFVHASDEWFLLADLALPEEEYYEGYGQLENGVGMLRLFITEFDDYLSTLTPDNRKHTVSIATAKLAYPTIQYFADEIMRRYPNIKIHVYCITNHFFGELITVTGLMTATDLVEQLKDKELGERLLLPENVMKADEDIFLDDITLNQFQRTLQVPVDIVKSNGQDFIESIIHKG